MLLLAASTEGNSKTLVQILKVYMYVYLNKYTYGSTAVGMRKVLLVEPVHKDYLMDKENVSLPL